MSPRRRSIYQEYSSSDESSDATCESLPKRRRQRNMADEIAPEGCRKRGRGPSKRPCLNRNAQMARENRQKKKEYVERIENKLAQLQQENNSLNNLIQQQDIDIKKLNADVMYLRSILKNSSNITLLLKSMNQNLQNLRTKTERKTLPQVNERVNFSNLETSKNKPFVEDCKIKREDEQVRSKGYHQDKIEPYRMNNNIKGNCKIATKTAYSFPELDHNYTSLILSADENQTFENSEQEDKFENLLPITPISNINDTDFNEFTSFDHANIFDDLAQLDEVSNTVDFEQESPLISDNFFQGLDDNTGICLHVNPNRVSLEFCSSCQMNSANSVFE